MEIHSLTPTNNAIDESAKTPGGGTVNKLEFLQLLMAQLKNQDPLQPQDGAEFVAQLAQFTSLEQLIDINESIHELGQLLAAGGQSQPTSTPTDKAGASKQLLGGGNSLNDTANNSRAQLGRTNPLGSRANDSKPEVGKINQSDKQVHNARLQISRTNPSFSLGIA